jgi:antitoxin CptB
MDGRDKPGHNNFYVHDKSEVALYINPARPRPGFWRWSDAMTGIGISSAGLDERRRRLLFRSWHRGIREMDLVLGRFADTHIAKLSEPELDEYERWLEVPDQRIFAWVNGAQAAPPEFDTVLFRRLREFHLSQSHG